MCAVRAISAVMFSGGGVVARTLSPHVAVALAAPFRTSIPSSPLVTTCTSVASGFPIASFPTGRLFIAAPPCLDSLLHVPPSSLRLLRSPAAKAPPL
ncbi:hypothetical protein PF011_g29956, partial [Phytophthora fragariae]